MAAGTSPMARAWGPTVLSNTHEIRSPLVGWWYLAASSCTRGFGFSAPGPMYGASAWRCCEGVGPAGRSFHADCRGSCEAGVCAAQFSAASSKMRASENPIRDACPRFVVNGETFLALRTDVSSRRLDDSFYERACSRTIRRRVYLSRELRVKAPRSIVDVVFQSGTRGYFVGAVRATISRADAKNSGVAAGKQRAGTGNAGLLAVERGKQRDFPAALDDRKFAKAA